MPIQIRSIRSRRCEELRSRCHSTGLEITPPYSAQQRLARLRSKGSKCVPENQRTSQIEFVSMRRR